MSPHYAPENQDLVALQDQLNRVGWKIGRSPERGKYAVMDSQGIYRGDCTIEEIWEAMERAGYERIGR